MIVDKITLEIIISTLDLVVKNYKTIQEAVCKEVDEKYHADYNYGVEYDYDFRVVNLQTNDRIVGNRVMVLLMIYKDEEMARFQKEAEERLTGGM